MPNKSETVHSSPETSVLECPNGDKQRKNKSVAMNSKKQASSTRKEKADAKNVSNSSKRIFEYMSSISGPLAKKDKKESGVGTESPKKVDISVEVDFDDDEEFSDHFDSGIDLNEETSYLSVDAEQNNKSPESLRTLCETRQKSLNEQLRENFRLHQERKKLKEEATQLEDALKEGREILAVLDTVSGEEEKEGD